MDRLHDWLQVFWWTRGAVAAIALVTIGAPILNIEQFEFIVFIHSAIVFWQYTAGLIGNWISNFLPFRLGPITINILIVIASSTVPLFYFAARRVLPLSTMRWQPYAYGAGCLFVAIFSIYSITQGIKWDEINRPTRELCRDLLSDYRDQNIDQEVRVAFRECDIDYIFDMVRVADFSGNDSIISEEERDNVLMKMVIDSVLLLKESRFMKLILAFLAFCAIGSAILSKSYRMGAVSVALFFVTIEILYYTPVIGGVLRTFVDTVFGPSGPPPA